MMMGLGFGGLGLIFMLIFWVAIIGLAVWFLGNLFPRAATGSPFLPPAQRSGPSESALEILKQRYARGEISKAEYEEMRRDLMELEAWSDATPPRNDGYVFRVDC